MLESEKIVTIKNFETSSHIVDMSNAMTSDIDELKKVSDELKESKDVLAAATEQNRKKITTLENNIESYSERIDNVVERYKEYDKSIQSLIKENQTLHSVIDELLKVEVCVPYEEGYLRAIGATRTVSIKDLINND